MGRVFAPTDNTQVRRKPERASYERQEAYAVLDEALVAHVGFAVDGQPFVVPMVFGRDGDRLLLHGSVASRILRALADGVRVCVTVTLVDGLVLAHAQVNHSVNYRCVMVVGTARLVDGDAAAAALTRVVDHVIPGRSAEARPADAADLRRTAVVELAIEEASVKARVGPPAAPSAADADLEVWTGVVPLTVVAGSPVPDGQGFAPDRPPASVSPWRRPGGG